jgi:DNA-binding response OmpR family regulator
VKIIAMSGLGADADGAKPNIPFSDAFIAKPFRAEELIAAVHKLLKESPRSVR